MEPIIKTDIEARVMDIGDIMTGELNIKKDNSCLILQNENQSKTGLVKFFPTGALQLYTNDSSADNFYLGTNTAHLLLYPADVQTEIKNRFLVGWDGELYNIYHSGNKPILNNIAYLGSNLFTDETDTIESWSAINQGFVWYDNTAALTKPANYGFLYNLGNGSEIFQLWKTMDSGPIYVRSGNHNGWGQSWTQIYDKKNPPTALEVGAKANRRCIVGQTTSATTNPWYKFAYVKMSIANSDRAITFKVSQGYGDNAKMTGILTAHIRVDANKNFANAQLTWEYANEAIILSDWVLAYKQTDNTYTEIELWAKQDQQWALFHFEVLSEHDRTGWTSDWTLYDTKSAGSQAEIPTDYTQIQSIFSSLKTDYLYARRINLTQSSSISSNIPAEINFTTVQTDNNITTNASFIRVYDDHDSAAYGNNMVIQSSGNMFIGAGESPNVAYNTDFLNNTAENMYITSDNNIYFYTNCNTYANKKTSVYINTSGVLYGAAWNDYAEFRDQEEKIEPGYCVISQRNGKVKLTTEKLSPCDGVVSDTYGFAIGETEKCQTPLAVSGRVLVYYYGNKEDYEIGDCVCAGPRGLVYKMTREEIKEYPDRIVGIISEIPEYEVWGENNILVNNRIWIKVK